MWTIVNLDLSAVAGAQAFMSDGAPAVSVARGGAGSSVRLMVSGLGSLDITDLDEQGGGPQPWLLIVGQQAYWKGDNAALSIVVGPGGTCSVSGDGNAFNVQLVPFPPVDERDLELFSQMATSGFLPYPDLPPDGRPYGDVAQTAAAMFAYSPAAMDLGLSVYDWTTPDFFRMDVFNYYRYIALAGAPLSDGDIINAIWTTNWPPYQPSDAQFMASMLMSPCYSELEVQVQYDRFSAELKILLDALKRITVAAVQSMPRTSILSIPALYSGQVDVSNLGAGAFATYFLEYPGNAGPPGTPMGMPLEQALETFLAPDQPVTLKSFLSTTDSEQDALRYSNGILLQLTPDPSRAVWTDCAYVTPLSNEATKTEYLFVPGSRFLMGKSWQETMGGKTITIISMQELG